MEIVTILSANRAALLLEAYYDTRTVWSLNCVLAQLGLILLLGPETADDAMDYGTR